MCCFFDGLIILPPTLTAKEWEKGLTNINETKLFLVRSMMRITMYLGEDEVISIWAGDHEDFYSVLYAVSVIVSVLYQAVRDAPVSQTLS